jgi:hypothetical protein
MLCCDNFIPAQRCPLFSSPWVGDEHETIFITELLGKAACLTVRTATWQASKAVDFTRGIEFRKYASVS